MVREIGGGWELREGIAEEGNGEARATATTKERRLGRTMGVGF